MILLLAAIVTLETDTTRIGFDPARKGAIVSLVDKASHREFVPAQATAPQLYELQLTNTLAGAGLTLTETDAASMEVKREGNSVIITARHNKPSVNVECRFRTDAGSSLIFSRIAVRNVLGHALTSVSFPALVWQKQLGEAAQRDFLVLPRADGCLVQAPGNVRDIALCRYPGSPLQLLARYDDTAGVYVATHDSKGFTKSFSARKKDDTLRLALKHLPPLQSGGEWRTDYDVAIGTFRGDWQTAADIYKKWTIKQPWCRRTFAQRVAAGDVPRWVTEPCFNYGYYLTGEIAPNQKGNRLSLVPQQAEAWRALFGVPTTVILHAWEKHGAWIAPDFFPPFGGERDFRAMTKALHDKGHRAHVPLTSLKWTLRRQRAGEPVMFDDTAAFNKRGAASAVCGVDGRPYVDGKPTGGQGLGVRAYICPATPLARELLLSTALECQRLGIDCVGNDLVGGGTRPCFSTKHGHPPGGGNWSANALYAIYDEIRREGKKRDPNFVLTNESVGEFFIPVLDTYGSSDYEQSRYPRHGEGVIGVPLFTHVYHEFLYGRCGARAIVSPRWGDLVAHYHQGMSLVCGKAPGAAAGGRAYDPAAAHESQVRLLRGYFDLWRGPAREFLVFGERVACQPLDVPEISQRFFPMEHRDPDAKPTEYKPPSVLHSVWRSSSGAKAAVFVCIDKKRVTFDAFGSRFSLQPGEVKFLPISER
jgi:hypothetical protein